MPPCPACGTASISATTRQHMGVIKRTPCPHCGTLLRLKWGRALIAAYLLILCIAGLAGYIAWPRDRHLVQSLGSSFLVVMFIVLAAILRPLPLTAGPSQPASWTGHWSPNEPDRHHIRARV